MVSNGHILFCYKPIIFSVFVLPALKHMQRLMTLMPECDYSTGRKVTR